MTDPLHDELSRLERRIMDVVYKRGEAPVADVVDDLDYDDAPDSVRVTMAKLEKKGFLDHRRDGARKIYRPTIPEKRARKSAMKHLVETFFQGSSTSAILEFLNMSGRELSDDEIAEIRSRIDAVDDTDEGDTG